MPEASGPGWTVQLRCESAVDDDLTAPGSGAATKASVLGSCSSVNIINASGTDWGSYLFFGAPGGLVWWGVYFLKGTSTKGDE